MNTRSRSECASKVTQVITCQNSGSSNKWHNDKFENRICRSGWRGSCCGTNSSLERQVRPRKPFKPQC